jgi:hypothetical protein
MDGNGTPVVKPNNNREDDPVSAEPYRWEDCTVNITITLLPQESGAAHERVALVGARTHADAPLIRRLPAYQVLPLPPALTQILEELREQLPARAAHYEERKARAAVTATPAPHRAPASGQRHKTGRGLTATKTPVVPEPGGWSDDLFSAPPLADKPECGATAADDPPAATPAASANLRNQGDIKAPSTQLSFL